MGSSPAAGATATDAAMPLSPPTNCWRTGKLSKSALEETTGAKSYMCLEIKRVH
jgi:hypothetical protein